MAIPETPSAQPLVDDIPPVGGLGSRFDSVLAAAVGGDASAFGELWRSAHPGLLRYLFVLCGGNAAEDVASETWVKVLRSIDSFTGDERAFRGWLATIGRHTAIDRSRYAARRPEVLDGTISEAAAERGADTADLALEALSTESTLRLVSQLLAPHVAEMVILRVVVGLDVGQVALLVGRKPGAVRVAVHRGLKTMASALTRAPDSSARSAVTVVDPTTLATR